MGVCRDLKGRLCCEKCGNSGGVRRRTCPYTVANYIENTVLPFCRAPYLCKKCYRDEGGLRHVHGRNCFIGATQRQKKANDEYARWILGEWQCRTRWGDWKPGVPKGKVAARYCEKGGREIIVLVEGDLVKADWLSQKQIEALPLFDW